MHVFRPGDVCQESGVYEVVHDPWHRDEHEVICLAGRKFPPCNVCHGGVRFALKYPAQHIDKDRSFSD